MESIHGLMSQVIKDRLFNQIGSQPSPKPASWSASGRACDLQTLAVCNNCIYCSPNRMLHVRITKWGGRLLCTRLHEYLCVTFCKVVLLNIWLQCVRKITCDIFMVFFCTLYFYSSLFTDLSYWIKCLSSFRIFGESSNLSVIKSFSCFIFHFVRKANN